MYGGKSRENIDSMKKILIKSIKLVLSSHETKKDVFSSCILRFESFCNNLVIGRRKLFVGAVMFVLRSVRLSTCQVGPMHNDSLEPKGF